MVEIDLSWCFKMVLLRGDGDSCIHFAQFGSFKVS